MDKQNYVQDWAYLTQAIQQIESGAPISVETLKVNSHFGQHHHFYLNTQLDKGICARTANVAVYTIAERAFAVG